VPFVGEVERIHDSNGIDTAQNAKECESSRSGTHGKNEDRRGNRVSIVTAVRPRRQLVCAPKTDRNYTSLLVAWAGRPAPWAHNRVEGRMLWTIFVILLVLWLLGMVSSYTLGGFIHILLVIAVVVLIIRLIQGRPVV
jgi:Family of unknown function (DUF5670)